MVVGIRCASKSMKLGTAHLDDQKLPFCAQIRQAMPCPLCLDVRLNFDQCELFATLSVDVVKSDFIKSRKRSEIRILGRESSQEMQK